MIWTSLDLSGLRLKPLNPSIRSKAGALGHVLYLAAEAEGFGATGALTAHMKADGSILICFFLMLAISLDIQLLEVEHGVAMETFSLATQTIVLARSSGNLCWSVQ